MNGEVFVVDFFGRCIIAPDSVIASMFLLGKFGGVPIQFIKIISGLLISILLIISSLPAVVTALICSQWGWWKIS